MRIYLSIVILFISSFCWTQSSTISEKLENLSKNFNSLEITVDGNTTHSVFFNFKNDTLLIIDSKGLSDLKRFTNSIYLIPIKEVASIDYVELNTELKKYADLKIKTKDELPTLLQITELSEEPLKQFVAEYDNIYDANYKVKVALPLIEKSLLYKELEKALKSLLD